MKNPETIIRGIMQEAAKETIANLAAKHNKPGPNDPGGQTNTSKSFSSAINAHRIGTKSDLNKIKQQFRASRGVQQPIAEEKKESKKACWSGYVAKGTKNKGGRTVPNCVPIKEQSQLDEKSEAWQRKEGKDPEGGLNAKGVASYRKANPGSKLKTAVTTEPSKLKAGSK